MSLARHFFREMRPFFQMLEEPLGRSPSWAGMPRSLLDDPFFRQATTSVSPAVDVTEEGNNYIIEAELPGVKKENIEVRVGDGGRSVTIEGRIIRRSEPASTETVSANASSDGTTTTTANDETAIAQRPEQNQLSVERQFREHTAFSRTVWLPRQVDAQSVSARLADGVLTVTVPRAPVEADGVQVPIQ